MPTLTDRSGFTGSRPPVSRPTVTFPLDRTLARPRSAGGHPRPSTYEDLGQGGAGIFRVPRIPMSGTDQVADPADHRSVPRRIQFGELVRQALAVDDHDQVELSAANAGDLLA